jgi:hypothetical protein
MTAHDERSDLHRGRRPKASREGTPGKFSMKAASRAIYNDLIAAKMRERGCCGAV